MTSHAAQLVQINILHISVLGTCASLRGQGDERQIQKDAATCVRIWTSFDWWFANPFRSLLSWREIILPPVLLFPLESITISSSKRRWNYTLSLQLFGWAWTPHWVLLTCTALIMSHLGTTLPYMRISSYKTCSFSNLTAPSIPALKLLILMYQINLGEKNLVQLSLGKTAEDFNTQWLLWQRQDCQVRRFKWSCAPSAQSQM